MGVLAGCLIGLIAKKWRLWLVGNSIVGGIVSYIEVRKLDTIFIYKGITIIVALAGAFLLLFLGNLLVNRILKKKKHISSIPNGLFPSKKRNRSSNIFISYRRQDNPDITGRIYDRLTNHYTKERVFFDVDSVPIGVDFRHYIDEKVGQCEVLITIIGNSWLDCKDTEGNRRIDNPTDFVRLEIESALKRGIPVIPLLIHGAGMPKESDLPGALKDLTYRNALTIRTDPDFHKDVDRLIAGLELHLKKATPNT